MQKLINTVGFETSNSILFNLFIEKFSAILGSIPVRFFVAFMTFMITFVAYMLRSNISINILAMVRKNEVDPDVCILYLKISVSEFLIQLILSARRTHSHAFEPFRMQLN